MNPDQMLQGIAGALCLKVEVSDPRGGKEAIHSNDRIH